LSAAESLGWIGRETGIFQRLGVELDIVRTQTTGAVAAAGLSNGDWEFAEVGAAPLVEANFQGRDTVVVLAAEPYSSSFIVGRRGFDAPEKLAGGKIGVLSRGGQTELAANAVLDRWGLRESVEFVVLGTSHRVLDALAAGEVDCGTLTADFRFLGEYRHGFHVLADVGAELRFLGPCVGSSRRWLRAEPDTAVAVLRGFVGAIHLFKTEPGRVIPLLGRYLDITDEPVLAAIHAFYAQKFEADPQPPADGIRRLIETYAPRYPGAGTRTLADVTDSALFDEAMRRIG
jgi:ABC-type nitrate/sulfonate/bicarbonate transport system substrate-binding protein